MDYLYLSNPYVWFALDGRYNGVQRLMRRGIKPTVAYDALHHSIVHYGDIIFSHGRDAKAFSRRVLATAKNVVIRLAELGVPEMTPDNFLPVLLVRHLLSSSVKDGPWKAMGPLIPELELPKVAKRLLQEMAPVDFAKQVDDIPIVATWRPNKFDIDPFVIPRTISVVDVLAIHGKAVSPFDNFVVRYHRYSVASRC